MLVAGGMVNSVEESLAEIRRRFDETDRRLGEQGDAIIRQGAILERQGEKLDQIGDVLVQIARQDERHRALRGDVNRLEIRVESVDQRVDTIERGQAASGALRRFRDNWFWKVVIPLCTAAAGFLGSRLWALIIS